MPNPQMTCKALKNISDNCTVLKISKNVKYTFTQTNMFKFKCLNTQV
jgi:hypothetical protein